MENLPENCPYCGTATQSGEKFCSGCGRDIKPQELQRCAHCSAVLRPGAAFCSQCGETILPSEEAAVPLPPMIGEMRPSEYEIITSVAKEESPVEEPFFSDALEWPEVPLESEEWGEVAPKEAAPTVPQEVGREEAPFTIPQPVSSLTPEADEERGGLVPPVVDATERLAVGGVPELTAPIFKNTEEFEYVKQEAKKPPKVRKNRGWILVLLLLLIGLGVVLVWTKLLPSSFGKTPPTEVAPQISTPGPLVPREPEGEAKETAPKVPASTTYPFEVNRLIAPLWDKAGDFDEFNLARVEKNGKVGLINPDGKEVVSPTYDEIDNFSDGYAVVRQGEKQGYMDVEGTLVVPLEYDFAGPMAEDLGVVSSGGKQGYMSPQGIRLGLAYDTALPFSSGFAGVSKKEQYYFISPTGEQMSPMYEGVGSFSQGLAPVKSGGLWGYVDETFTEIIPPTYSEGADFKEGLAVVKMGENYFLINDKGEEVSPKVEEMWPMSEGLATVKSGGRYGFVDGTGTHFTIEPQYFDVFAYKEGLIPVAIRSGTWAYVDKTNNAPFKETYDEAYSFSEGFARVKKDLSYTLITKDGQQAVKESWEEIGSYKQGRLAVKEAGQWGYIELK